MALLGFVRHDRARARTAFGRLMACHDGGWFASKVKRMSKFDCEDRLMSDATSIFVREQVHQGKYRSRVDFDGLRFAAVGTSNLGGLCRDDRERSLV